MCRLFLFIAAVLMSFPSANARELDRVYEDLPLGRSSRTAGCVKCFSVREMVSQLTLTRYIRRWWASVTDGSEATEISGKAVS